MKYFVFAGEMMSEDMYLLHVHGSYMFGSIGLKKMR